MHNRAISGEKEKEDKQVLRLATHWPLSSVSAVRKENKRSAGSSAVLLGDPNGSEGTKVDAEAVGTEEFASG